MDYTATQSRERIMRVFLFVIGSAFCVDGSGHDRVRLSFSWPSPENIREGARRLAAAMEMKTVRS